MRKFTSALTGTLFPALIAAGIFIAPAMAQDKGKMEKAAGKVALKELTKNDKFRVYEATFKPGDEGASIDRPARVVRYLKGGTMEYTYPDGKKETKHYKDGEVRIAERGTYMPRNIGKTTMHLYIVQSL